MNASIHTHIQLGNLTSGNIPIDLVNFEERFAPKPFTGPFNTLFFAAFTPTAATCSIYLSEEGVMGGTNMTLDAWLTQGTELGTLRYLRIYARRKSGTTGTVASQSFTFYRGTAVGTLIGSIRVGAAAAGEEVVSDVFPKEYRETVGNLPDILTEAQPLFFSTTAGAADPDLEIVVLALGQV